MLPLLRRRNGSVGKLAFGGILMATVGSALHAGRGDQPDTPGGAAAAMTRQNVSGKGQQVLDIVKQGLIEALKPFEPVLTKDEPTLADLSRGFPSPDAARKSARVRQSFKDVVEFYDATGVKQTDPRWNALLRKAHTWAANPFQQSLAMLPNFEDPDEVLLDSPPDFKAYDAWRDTL